MCCSVTRTDGGAAKCPASAFPGKPVDWMTVAALTHGRVPTKQEFRLCRDAECETVYYGSDGTILTGNDLNVQPGFKAGSDELVWISSSRSRKRSRPAIAPVR